MKFKKVRFVLPRKPTSPYRLWPESKAITPPSWRRVRIVPRGNKFSIWSFIGFTKYNSADMKALFGDHTIKTEDITLSEAMNLGLRMETAMTRMNGSLKKKERG